MGIELNPGPSETGYLDEETRWEIVFLIKRNHLTPTQVSKELNVSRPTVYQVWDKYQGTGTVHDRPKSGRKRKLSAAEETAAYRAAKRGKTAPQIAQSLNMNVCDRTVSRSLKRGGLRYLMFGGRTVDIETNRNAARVCPGNEGFRLGDGVIHR